jgi:hypothetical protein
MLLLLELERIERLRSEQLPGLPAAMLKTAKVLTTAKMVTMLKTAKMRMMPKTAMAMMGTRVSSPVPQGLPRSPLCLPPNRHRNQRRLTAPRAGQR